jgi:2-polyprenyl-6-methoxyphenol hydroxylase-like FAD-dependent oxidoreductase
VSVRTVDTATGGVTDFLRYEATHRFPSTHVWRRDLLCILRDRLDAAGVTCHYGSTATVGELEADLIVGADGARSATRRSIGNLAEPTYTGQIKKLVRWRCVPLFLVLGSHRRATSRPQPLRRSRVFCTLSEEFPRWPRFRCPPCEAPNDKHRSP